MLLRLIKGPDVFFKSQTGFLRKEMTKKSSRLLKCSDLFKKAPTVYLKALTFDLLPGRL